MPTVNLTFLALKTNSMVEHFGDWVIRAGYITAVERGGQHGAMHEGVPDEED
jgi:hypothetical protein